MAQSKQSSLPQCVACLEPHDGPLILCAQCEQFAQESRKRAGLPIRVPSLQPVREEPDD